MQDHFARHHPRLDLTRTVARLELVFASLQRRTITVEKGEEVEPHRVVDDARALELLGDAAAIVVAHNIDDLVRGKRSGLSPLHHQPRDRADRQDGAAWAPLQEAARVWSARAPLCGRRRKGSRLIAEVGSRRPNAHSFRQPASCVTPLNYADQRARDLRCCFRRPRNSTSSTNLAKMALAAIAR